MKTLRAAFPCDEVRVDEAYRKLRNAVAGMKISLDAWHKYNVQVWVRVAGRATRGGWTIVGKSGMTIQPDDYAEGYERRNTLAAFRLQDQEAAFIHALTILSMKYGFVVCQNEHDGLITIGVIPQAAVIEASALSGLRPELAQLVEKNFI
jgi:hypothetical protein